MSDTFYLILWVGIPASAIIWFIYSFIRNRGFRGMMFNAPVKSTPAEIRFTNGVIKVHILDKKGQEHVGLECAHSSLFGYDMQPHTLTIGEARALIQLLEAAVLKTQP